MRKKTVLRLAGVLVIQAALLWHPSVALGDYCEACYVACEYAYIIGQPAPDRDCIWNCSCECDSNGNIVFFDAWWDCPYPPPPPPDIGCFSDFDCLDGYYCDWDGRCKPWF